MQRKSTKKQHTGRQPAKKPRRDMRSETVRINLTIPKSLLETVDEAAVQDYTTRSDIIRIALLWYLRPQGRDLDQADPEVIIKVLKRRQARAGLNKLLKQETIDEDIYDD